MTLTTPADLLLDVSRLVKRATDGCLPTGVDRVCLAYVERWGERAQAVLQKNGWRWIVPYAQSQRLFEILLDSRSQSVWQIYSHVYGHCFRFWHPQDGRNRTAFFLSHQGIERPDFIEWIQRRRIKPVFFVHDLIPITHPEFARAGIACAHSQRLKVCLQHGAGLMVNSRDTLSALNKFAEVNSLKMLPHVIAKLAPAPLSLIHTKTRLLAAPYFVVLGTIEPRKNHMLLLNLWRELVTKLGERTPHLIVIGQRGWECENVLDMLERCNRIGTFVHELNTCSDAELANYLRHAQALLFPSIAEGYGMPLVEALQQGTPVIASNLQVFQEIAFGVPEVLHHLDGIAWMQAIEDYTDTHHPRRQAQLQRLQFWQCSSWDEHFSVVERFLEAL